MPCGRDPEELGAGLEGAQVRLAYGRAVGLYDARVLLAPLDGPEHYGPIEGEFGLFGVEKQSITTSKIAGIALLLAGVALIVRE